MKRSLESAVAVLLTIPFFLLSVLVLLVGGLSSQPEHSGLWYGSEDPRHPMNRKG